MGDGDAVKLIADKFIHGEDVGEPTPIPSREGNKGWVTSQEGHKSGKNNQETNYKNETQQNLIKVVEYLARDIFKPTTPQEIMTALGLTKSKAIWTLYNLKLGGWAEQTASGWRLSPAIAKIAESIRATLKEVIHKYLND
jgi:hypothetical protein